MDEIDSDGRQLNRKADDHATKNDGQEAEFDAWLKAQIQEAIDDPRPSIPSEEVERHFAKKREILRNRIAKSTP